MPRACTPSPSTEAAKEEVLFRSPESKRLTDWSRDNRFLIYTARSPKTGTDVWALPTMGDLKPQPLDQTPANESQGRLSPDGRWIAYVSDQSGSEEVYVRAFSSVGRADGRSPLAAARDPDGAPTAESSISSQPMASSWPSMSRPHRSCSTALRDRCSWCEGPIDFAVSPDGRFLVQMPVNESGNRELHVVLNWAAELRR